MAIVYFGAWNWGSAVTSTKKCGSGFVIGQWAEARTIWGNMIENTQISLNRLMVEIWMLITLLGRSEK